jgi:hypothetical protein
MVLTAISLPNVLDGSTYADLIIDGAFGIA